MRRGDYAVVLAGMAFILAVFVFFGIIIQDMHYKWTTPPDSMCNVWEH